MVSNPMHSVFLTMYDVVIFTVLKLNSFLIALHLKR